MPGLSCNACNKEFLDNVEQKLHYKSDWHRYNLKCKDRRKLCFWKNNQLLLKKDEQNETLMLYSCGLCAKGYRSSKTYSQHLKSRTHIVRASQGTNHPEEEAVIVTPLPRRAVNKPPQPGDRSDEESEDEWVDVDPEEDLVGHAANSLNELNLNEEASGDEADTDDEEEEELDPCCCFMCDLRHDTIERCMLHMHKFYGFFIPDVEYLKDPEGLLTYLGLEVKRDFMCLYCNERCHPFTSLEAVRKHMAAKAHCRVHYGDADEDEEGELEEFYDYSSSYVDGSGNKLIVAADMGNTVQLGDSLELVLRRRSDQVITTKTLGCREYLLYYRRKPPPSPANNMPIIIVSAARYRSMVLATMRSREHIESMKAISPKNKRTIQKPAARALR